MATKPSKGTIVGYEIGQIPARAAITIEIICPGPVPLQAMIDHQYVDSKTMSRRPGMYLKYLPFRYDEVTSKLVTGGCYLFDSWENAKDYGRWATDEFKVGDEGMKMPFWDQFESHRAWLWRLVGGYHYAPIQEHTISRLRHWSYSGEGLDEAAIATMLQQAYQELRKAAEAIDGVTSVWLLHNPEDKRIGLQLSFRKTKDGSAEKTEPSDIARDSLAHASRQPLLDHLLPQQALGMKPTFERDSMLLTLWLPKSRDAGGSELCIPLYPFVPDITHEYI